MTTLTTTATVTLGRLRYTSQVRSASVELALLPGVGRADVLVAAGVEVSAAPGDEAVVELDGGEGAATVVTGTVEHVERRTTGTLVSVVDGGAALAAVRPAETYNQMPAAQVIGRLAGLAGVPTGLVAAALQTSAYVADPRRTGGQHVAALATRSGAVATIDADGRLQVRPLPTGQATAALRRDRELTSLATSTHRAQHEFVAVGSGGSGAAAAPDAWLVGTSAVTGGGAPDAARTWRPDPLLRSQADVDLVNRGAGERRAAETRRLRAAGWLLPARRPGDVLEIQEVAHDDEAGPWLLTTVRHELAWDRAATTLTGIGGGGGLLGGLTGGLTGGGLP